MKTVKFASWLDIQEGMRVVCTCLPNKTHERYGSLATIKWQPLHRFGLFKVIWDDQFDGCYDWSEKDSFDSSIIDISDLIIELKKYDIYVIASSSAKHIIFSILSEDSIETETNKFFIALKRHNEKP